MWNGPGELTGDDDPGPYCFFMDFGNDDPDYVPDDFDNYDYE